MKAKTFVWAVLAAVLGVLGALALVLALTLVTNIIVQVLKSLLYDMLPTNLLAFLVAAVVTVGAGFGLWSYYRFAITGWMIVADRRLLLNGNSFRLGVSGSGKQGCNTFVQL